MGQVLEEGAPGRSYPEPPYMNASIHELEIRQFLYRYFAAFFLYPNQERLLKLQTFSERLADLGDEWAHLPFAAPLKALVDLMRGFPLVEKKALVDEFNRLFQVKPVAPPYETYFRATAGHLDGRIAAEIHQAYASSGLNPSPILNEQPDHLALELEFLSFLCGKEIEAIRADDQEAADLVRNEQGRFLEEHLARWFPAFAKKAGSEAQLEVHRKLLQSLFAFLRNELAILETAQKF